MKRILTLLALTGIMFAGCNSKPKQTATAEVSASAEKTCCETPVANGCCAKETVEVSKSQLVYFHNERRCATCMAVEDVAKEVIAQYDAAEISFHSYQIDDEACAEMVKNLQISGQTLLLMGKDTTLNLTNEAFMYARVNPEKYKEVLNAALKSVI